MNNREMEKLTRHFDTYFRQNDSVVVHPIILEPHIDALLYAPNAAYPYWKLVTMGASDYKMSVPKGALGNRNEYMMFIHPDEKMADPEVVNWYFGRLIEIAMYPIAAKSFLAFGHSVEWAWAHNDNEEMIGAYLTFPQVVPDIGVLRCKLGFMKTALCLQAVLLNREEIDTLLKIGPQRFDCLLYPDNGDRHFICERKRTDKF